VFRPVRPDSSLRMHLAFTLLLFLLWSCADAGASDPAIDVVAASLGPNELGVDASALKTLPNPKGEGTFVYVPETRLNGVERKVVWLVIDNQAYPLTVQRRAPLLRRFHGRGKRLKPSGCGQGLIPTWRRRLTRSYLVCSSGVARTSKTWAAASATPRGRTGA
jgi:hypothetical protein